MKSKIKKKKITKSRKNITQLRSTHHFVRNPYDNLKDKLEKYIESEKERTSKTDLDGKFVVKVLEKIEKEMENVDWNFMQSIHEFEIQLSIVSYYCKNIRELIAKGLK